MSAEPKTYPAEKAMKQDMMQRARSGRYPYGPSGLDDNTDLWWKLAAIVPAIEWKYYYAMWAGKIGNVR